MAQWTSTHLPIFNDQQDDDTPSCSPKIYVSNEEKSILDEMRALRDRAVELRGRLASTAGDDDRDTLEAELAALRRARAELAVRREQAFKRKMIMLGHLPPDDEISLF
jgi:hypothetical protein